MENGKTYFEQVPIAVAENALRRQTSPTGTLTNGNPLLRNPSPLPKRPGGLRRRRPRIWIN